MCGDHLPNSHDLYVLFYIIMRRNLVLITIGLKTLYHIYIYIYIYIFFFFNLNRGKRFEFQMAQTHQNSQGGQLLALSSC